MTKFKGSMVKIKIDGRSLPIVVARARYRCEVCNGKLTRTDNRLHCASNAAHRGLIHKDVAEQRQAQQQDNINNLPYKIVNGRIEPCQS